MALDDKVVSLADLKESHDYLKNSVDEINADLEKVALIDGSYSSMTVGNAEQLVATVGEEDNTPYNFRTSGGNIDIGDRETDMVVGGTVCWNQFFDPTAIPASDRGVTLETVNDSAVKITGTATANKSNAGWFGFSENSLFKTAKDGDKIIIITTVLNGSASLTVRFNQSVSVGLPRTVTIGDSIIFSYSFTGTSTQNPRLSINIPVDTVFDNFIFTGIAANLTQMFGSTIADYIYNLESATRGAGVAWFRKLFPKDYYEYNSGELMSVKTSAHKMVGFNQLDESAINNLTNITKVGDHWTGTVGQWISTTGGMGRKWVDIRFLENTSYCCSAYVTLGSGTTSVKIRVVYTDGTSAEGTPLYSGRSGIVRLVSDGSKTVNYFAFTYGSGTSGILDVYWMNINLSWDGERDGEHELYEEYVYPLDSSLELLGIPKLDSSNNLYYAGDTYEADGTVTRKYRKIGYSDITGFQYGTNAATGIPYVDLSMTHNPTEWAVSSSPCLAKGYTWIPNTTNPTEMTIRTYNTALTVYSSSFTDLETARQILQNQDFAAVYELVTPTTEESEPYQNPQIVDDFGTEEYIDTDVESGDRDVAIPVGHETTYMANLRAKLEMSPDSPSADGEYIVKQTNGENEYVTLASSDTIQSILAKLPSAPSEDGTYTLTVTVSDGTATYSWGANS